LYFSWSVPKKGYTWVKIHPDATEKSEGLFLVEKYGEPKRRIYSPLEDEPELFSRFAKLEPTSTKAILKFANKYGNLTKGNLIVPDSHNKIEKPINIEPFKLWCNEISEFALTYRIWRCLEEQRFEDLGLYIRWDKIDGTDVFYVISPFSNSRYLTANNPQSEAIFNTFTQNDLIAPAKFFLQTILSRKLKGGISLMPLEDSSWNLYPYIMPDNLLRALWLQMYLAVTGEKTFIQCEWCGYLLEVTEKTRITRKYHDNCRMAMWRQKKNVVNLSEQGKTIDEIAAETKLPREKVAEWLEEN